MKKKIKQIVGVVIIILSILISLYVGGWYMFIQPIMDACKAFDAGSLTGVIVGTTIIKCVFASFVGSIIFISGYYFGLCIYLDA